MPQHVLNAYMELGKLRRQRGKPQAELIPLTIHGDIVEKIYSKSSQLISEKCFEFLQKLTMKNCSLVNATTAFGGLYTLVNDQTIQCCIFPNENKQQPLQFNSLWSSFVKNVYGILKNNQKKKVKAWSCKCTTSDVQINDLCLVCQPLFYDQQNTLHTAIT